ncbi:hypothetical protein Tco_0659155 [Tanacetum coccineum]
MTTLKFADTHNMVAFLSKPAESNGFEQIVDFLNAHPIRVGKAIPTDPHHTPTFIQPSTQPQKIQQPRKPKRNDTQVPQPSDPIENVAYEVVHKELGDSLVRAATTVSSLEAEQDSETMGDTIAQTRFENVSKHSNDSLLARGNTLQSDKDRLKLDELMARCTTLQNRVLDLEKTKTTQHNENASLKMRVKKLEKKNRSRTHRLKRLYKIGLTSRVESSDNEESLGEDASKQGRIDVIDTDKEITLENDEVNVVDEVVEVINTAKLITDAAQVSVVGNVVSTAGDATNVSATTTTTAPITTVDDISLAQALMEIKSTKPKEKGGVIQELGKPAKIDADHQLVERMQAQEQEELSIKEKAILFQQLLEKRRNHFAAKRAEEKRNKPLTKAQ